MRTILPSKRKEKVKRIESKLFALVDRKEKREQIIDDYGRSIVLALREYLQNDSRIKYRFVMKEALSYFRKYKHI